MVCFPFLSFLRHQHNLDGLEKAMRAEFTTCPPLFSKPEGLETVNPAPGTTENWEEPLVHSCSATLLSTH